MASEKDVAETAGKKANPGDQPVAETILEERDTGGGDEQSHTTIHAFVRDRLHEFNDEMEHALDEFEAHVNAQQEDFKSAFNQNGFFGFIGEVFERELLEFGGGGPLIQSMVTEIHGAVSFNEHACFDLATFVNNAFRRGVRDACWYVRDATPTLLGDKWTEMLKLAADGGNQFVPAMYHLGLPGRNFKPKEFGQKLSKHADSYRRAMGLQQKEVKQEETQQNSAKHEELEEQAQKDMIEQDSTKAAVI